MERSTRQQNFLHATTQAEQASAPDNDDFGSVVVALARASITGVEVGGTGGDLRVCAHLQHILACTLTSHSSFRLEMGTHAAHIQICKLTPACA